MRDDLQHKVYRFIRDNKLTPENMAKLVEIGMVPKDQLVDRAFYYGICRNAFIAQWIEKPGWPDKDKLPNNRPLDHGPCFYHMREKFGKIFVETINHPEDDNGFDLFIPLKRIKSDWGDN